MDAHPDFEDALSLERFARYLAWAEGDRLRALDLYALNTRLSESLYTPLQMLEVALRNRIHAVMTDLHGPAWFQQEGMLLGDFQPGQVHSAVADICRQGREPSASRIVASLTFGFWTAMFGQAYEMLWQQGLIGSRGGRTARDCAERISPVR